MMSDAYVSEEPDEAEGPESEVESADGFSELERGPLLRGEALDCFLRRMRPRLTQVLTHFNIPRQDYEDVLQQSLLALVYRWRTVRQPEAWLVGAVRNNCMLYWRHRRRRPASPVEHEVLDWLAGTCPPEQERCDLRRDLERALAELPDRCRQVLRLRFGLGMKGREIAPRLGYSENSIGKIVQRCMEQLQQRMGAHRGEEQSQERQERQESRGGQESQESPTSRR